MSAPKTAAMLDFFTKKNYTSNSISSRNLITSLPDCTMNSNQEQLFNEEETMALRTFWKQLFGLLGLNPASEKSLPASKDGIESMISLHGREKFAEAFWNFTTVDDPDYTCIKFIRARKLNIDEAIRMLIECLKWRIEFNVDSVILKGDIGFMSEKGEDGDAFTKQISCGKTFVQGFSKMGGPVAYVFAKHYRTSEQSPKAMEEFVVYAMEIFRMFTINPQSKITAVIDLAGFGLVNMDWKATMFLNKCLEAYYPECLQTLVIFNAPWVFHGIWKVISATLDPVVRSKIIMTKSVEDIRTHIDPSYLLEELGGDSTWKWCYKVPNPRSELDNSKKQELLSQKKTLIDHYVKVTNSWIEDPSLTNAQLRIYVASMLRVNNLSLDPFIRGKTAYHEEGNIRENGQVGFRNSHTSSKWEFSKFYTSRDELLDKIKKFQDDFNTQKIDYPIVEFEL
ncbi:CRAL-TRIO domain-containing protein [Melampsora americana]|nr:CRAL-TRIO domain-containing protein [Melampsora americana]